MKIIFLDIDGVLNYQDYVAAKKQERTAQLKESPLVIPASEWYGPHQIDPEKVALLNRIVEETEAKVVISSTWRKRFTIEEMQALLEKRGFKGEVIDYTPEPFQKGNDRWSKTGDEIARWLVEREQAGRGPEFIYVVLDDDELHNIRVNLRQVRTRMERGLEEHHVEYAIRMLNLEQVCPKCGAKVYKAELLEGGFVTLNHHYTELYRLADYKVHSKVSGLDVHRCGGKK